MDAIPPVLLDVNRNGFVESHHRGAIVLLGRHGDVEVVAGSPESLIFPRSSLKPFQAVAMVELGFSGRGPALALSAASHDGEDVHRAGVRDILDAAGLGEDALQCPPALPSGEEAMLAHVRAGGGRERICHNCSGKHAAMVSTCAANGWDVAGYRDPAHPLQVGIRHTIERMTGEAVAATAVDGCGAPAYAVSLVGLARGFAMLAKADAETAAGSVRGAMQRHPRLVGGTGRAVTELTAEVPGLICKDGAEAVWGAALGDGRAFASKVEDGGARSFGPLLAAALRHWGVDAPAVRRWSSVSVLGGGAPVGSVTWSPDLRQLLAL